MLWIDRVRSAAYQTAKVIPSATANTAVLSSSGTPSASVRLSVISVPTTLISTTVSQYTPGTYWRGRDCQTSTARDAALITSVVPDRPRPSPLRKSAKVSPTVVESTLMIQKKTVTSGTLLSRVRAEVDGATGLVMAPPCPPRSEHGLNGVASPSRAKDHGQLWTGHAYWWSRTTRRSEVPLPGDSGRPASRWSRR